MHSAHLHATLRYYCWSLRSVASRVFHPSYNNLLDFVWRLQYLSEIVHFSSIQMSARFIFFCEQHTSVSEERDKYAKIKILLQPLISTGEDLCSCGSVSVPNLWTCDIRNSWVGFIKTSQQTGYSFSVGSFNIILIKKKKKNIQINQYGNVSPEKKHIIIPKRPSQSPSKKRIPLCLLLMRSCSTI